MIELAAICLAANIYFEARGEPVAGQMAVAHVTVRRANRDSNRICQQVLRKQQFSWLNGKTNEKDGVILAAFKQPKDRKAWQRSYAIANKVLKKKYWDNTGGATHFHATSVSPKWSRSPNMKVTATIGKHVFYKRVATISVAKVQRGGVDA